MTSSRTSARLGLARLGLTRLAAVANPLTAARTLLAPVGSIGVLGPISKQPNEVIDVAVDFAKRLRADEGTTGVTRLALDGVTDVSATLLSGLAGLLSSRIVSQKIQAGTGGKTYRLTLRASTGNGNTYEADVDLFVSET